MAELILSAFIEVARVRRMTTKFAQPKPPSPAWDAFERRHQMSFESGVVRKRRCVPVEAQHGRCAPACGEGSAPWPQINADQHR
jgi:hypothetical protein